jgi:hypothetical protein
VLRGAAILVAMLVVLVLCRLLVLFGVPGGEMLFMASILVVYGPAPFHAAMTPLHGPTYFELWPAAGLCFGAMTCRVKSIRRLIAWAAAAIVVSLVPLVIAAERAMADDWRRRPPAELREVVLAKTPIGTSMDDVRSRVVDSNWHLMSFDEQRGFLDQRARRATTIGSKHIRASAGDYQGFPFQVNTTIFWGFDDTGRLIDIWVWQTVDAL